MPIRHILLRLLALTFPLGLPFPAVSDPTIFHELKAHLSPPSSLLQVTDTFSLSDSDARQLEFGLNAELKIIEPANLAPLSTRTMDSGLVVNFYVLPLNDKRTATLRYEGAISTKFSEGGTYARSFDDSPGIITPDGAFLSAESYWIPVVAENLLRFRATVTTPVEWKVVSQGKRLAETTSGTSRTTVWAEDKPQDDFYLVAAAFHEYQATDGDFTAQAFLREKDDALAQKYLDATLKYRAMYQQLLGDYPYDKFALVENFWETGYGMPSFTLLGSQVMRLPFIINSSYPHELLHNWWGNGVYVDYEQGNWAEGLTAYLADHLSSEQQGRGPEYRRDTLQKYSDFVTESRDFPAREFVARHSAATEAVGYGKIMMLFHMLRKEMGDKKFVQALRTFYEKNRYTRASFTDLEQAFSETTGEDYSSFFSQWLDRTGAPSLKIVKPQAIKKKRTYRLNFTLQQTQNEPAYSFTVPIAITMEGPAQAHVERVKVTSRHQAVSISLPEKPLRIEVDPQYDVFRRLDSTEIPSALSQGFGAERVLLVFSRQESHQNDLAWQLLAQEWKKSQPGEWQAVYDDQLDTLPSDQAVWLLGINNKFRDSVLNSLKEQGVGLRENNLHLDEKNWSTALHSLMLSTRNPQQPQQTLLWLTTSNARAIPGLARKLPHYGKYSYLLFEGDEPSNVEKGQWKIMDSPLQYAFDDTLARSGTLPKRSPLATLPSDFSASRLKRDIESLSADKMEGRGIGTAGLSLAANYIANAFKTMKLTPGGSDKKYLQPFEVDVGEPHGNVSLSNVIAVLPGSNPRLTEPLVIGAHYDHLGFGWPDVHQGDEGKIHYGADDNASGVAVLLELARYAVAHWHPQRSIVFVAFTGEESQLLGSRHFVSNSLQRPYAMINLDTVGRLNNAPLSVFGIASASEWVHIFRGAQFVTGVDIKPISNDFGGSDQRSFLDQGIPAVQLFASSHSDFHRPTDTANKIDYRGLLKVISVLKEAAEYLANRTEPLTVAGQSAQASSSPPNSSGRKVSLGTVPDFSYSGEGVLITGTTPGSPAESAGLIAGDVLKKIDGTPISSLKDYAAYLRTLSPGQSVMIGFERNGESKSVTLTTQQR